MKFSVRVKAVLLSKVGFITDEGGTVIFPGTEIFVDPEKHIGLYEKHHFDLKREEYQMIYLN